MRLSGVSQGARRGRVVRVPHLGIEFTLGRHRRGRRPSGRQASPLSALPCEIQKTQQ